MITEPEPVQSRQWQRQQRQLFKLNKRQTNQAKQGAGDYSFRQSSVTAEVQCILGNGVLKTSTESIKQNSLEKAK